MTKSEFDRWWQDLQTRFPGKAKVFNNSQTLKTWFDVLQDTALDDAIWANRAFQDGSEEMPRSWDMIPAAIKATARQLRQQDNANYVDGDISLPYSGDASGCSWCGGKGWFYSKQGRRWHCRDCAAGLEHVDDDEGNGLDMKSVFKSPPQEVPF